jgi:hypothetical protein
MKFSKKLAALALAIGALGAASAVFITQPDVRADVAPIVQQANQQDVTPVSTVDPHIYYNKEMGFSFRFPDSWEGKYNVRSEAQNVDGFPAIIFSSNQYDFELMEIVKIPESTWDTEGYEESLYLKLATKDGSVYAALFPSETLFINEQEVTQISDMLNDMLPTVKHTFTLTTE